jgi:taurine transport system permease protein
VPGLTQVRTRAANLAWFVAPFAILLAGWAVAVEVTDVPRRVFPSPGDVWGAGAAMVADGSLWQHVAVSVQRTAIGALLAAVVAIPFGILMGVSRPIAAYFEPILRFSVALAGIAWIPLATLWFGFGHRAVIFIIFNAVFFALTYNAMLGVSRIAPDLHRAARSLGAPRTRMFLEVYLPGALPSIVTGLRVGMGYAWRGLIAAEIIATSAGLGYMLFLARRFYQTEIIVLSMVIIGLIWLLMDRFLLAPVERRTVQRWGMVARAEQ